MARPALDIDLVRQEFDGSVRRQKEILEESRELLLTEAVGALTPMFGPEGSLPVSLRALLQEIERELASYLDEGSTKSVSTAVGKRVEEAFLAVERRMERSLQDALDLSDTGRGLGKLFKALREENQGLNSQIVDLLARVSALVARNAEREGSARKGDDFEAGIFLEVARIASLNGDSAERTGTLNGDAARKRGDITVTLDPALASGEDVRFTLEAMDRRSGSLRSVLTELDQAKANRAARAAVGVLSSREAPCANALALQRFPGNRFLVVVDKESWIFWPWKSRTVSPDSNVSRRQTPAIVERSTSGQLPSFSIRPWHTWLTSTVCGRSWASVVAACATLRRSSLSLKRSSATVCPGFRPSWYKPELPSNSGGSACHMTCTLFSSPLLNPINTSYRLPPPPGMSRTWLNPYSRMHPHRILWPRTFPVCHPARDERCSGPSTRSPVGPVVAPNPR